MGKPRVAIWLLQLLLVLSAAAQGEDQGLEERLIGWRGEQVVEEDQVQEEPTSGAQQKEWIETIAWSPRAFIYHGFLSYEECDHLIAMATDRLDRSQVVGDGPESISIDPIRTSYSGSLDLGEDEVVASVEHRIARWTHLPIANGEPIEVLRYKNGQKYDAHWDWFDAKDLAKDGGSGQRTATVLMYLSDVEPDGGGETALPLATALDEERQSIEKGYSACASRQGISVKPRKGDVLLFWDQAPGSGPEDRAALHASCPTFKGMKWTATKWIHNVSYQGQFYLDSLAERGLDTDPFNGGKMPPGYQVTKSRRKQG